MDTRIQTSVAKRSVFLLVIFFPRIAFAHAPVYFDIGGWLLLLLFWIVTIVVSLFIKPRAATVPIAFLWPIAYFSVGSAIKDYQQKQRIAANEEKSKLAYRLCETASGVKVNNVVALKAPTSIRLIGDQSLGLTRSNSCWNPEAAKRRCDVHKAQEISPCWMTGQGCVNNVVAGIEFSYGEDSEVSGVMIPAPEPHWKQETLTGFTAPYELRVRTIENIVPYQLRRDELSLIDVSTNEVLSQVSYVFFSGTQGLVPTGGDWNKPSFFCPDRDRSVAELLSATFKIDALNGVEK